ncbi:MAG: glycosidase [Kiritimatiellae bacterium]|nr:glycosidase [Kiritimatiellia bacterium]
MSQTAPIEWKTDPAITRHPDNPLLTAEDVPYHATLVFNAGVCKYEGRYVMVFRNDYGDADAKRLDGVNQGLAFSEDGVKWDVAPKPLFHDQPDHFMYRLRDARLTVLEGKVYMTGWFNRRGVVAATAVTDDFERWEILNVGVPSNRNHVIFPERVGGKLIRLERPFVGRHDRFDTYISASPDGRYWGDHELLLPNDEAFLPWVNNKMGPAAPPVKTEKGWLAVIHGVDIDPARKGWGWSGDWPKRYSAGLMLLDRENPYKLIGLCRKPVLVPEPEYEYEAKGYRDYVIFPGASILEDSGEVKIYYGAADTVECLATAHVDDLLALCEPV